MAQRLVKHGTMAGYNAETETGDFCERCRNASRVYRAQFSKKAKAARGNAPAKYGTHDVIDHLYTGRRSAAAPNRSRTAPHSTHAQSPPDAPHSSQPPIGAATGSEPQPQPQTQPGPSVADRLTEGLRKFTGKSSNDEYVANDEPPDYIHESDPDPDIAGQWSDAPEEFVINKAGMELIEDNLGTYLSVLGITLEMIDPYCGPILAENFDNIISKWSKVIARYPRAAKLFMSKDGGTLMVWIGAIQATWPILLAIYEHHLAKNIQTDKQGRVFKVTKPSANGHGETVDATMPPMPDFEYTVN
jgi:hypothetical protein